MPVKRELIGISSGHLTPPVATTAPAPTISQARIIEPSVANAGEGKRPRILALASPIAAQSVGHSDQQKIGVFLEQCNYCRKKIAKDAEVYMYSDFCAFCSADCRDFQIQQDQLAEKGEEKHKQKEIGASKASNYSVSLSGQADVSWCIWKNFEQFDQYELRRV